MYKVVVNFYECRDYDISVIGKYTKLTGLVSGNSWFASFKVKRMITKFKKKIALAENTCTHVVDYATHP